jgi:hypothetical protein
MRGIRDPVAEPCPTVPLAVRERQAGAPLAVEIVWRKESDSNPRYGFPIAVFRYTGAGSDQGFGADSLNLEL